MQTSMISRLLVFACWSGCVVSLKPRPPSVTSFSTKDFFSDYLVADCSATGNPAPSITWMKDGQPLDVSSKRVEVKKGRLNITRATESDEGIYFCVVNNTFGVSRSQEKYLSKAVVLPFPTEKVKDTQGTAGQHFSLDCHGRRQSKPKPSLSDFVWFYGYKEVELDSRVTIDQTGTLHFLPLQKSDGTTSKSMYNCSLYNAEARKRVYGNAIKLDVSASEDAVKRKPIFVYKSPDTTVSFGGRLELQCIPDGNPTANLTWKTPSDVRVEKRAERYSLTVKDVRDIHAGTYTCMASNSEGMTSEDISVTVIPKLTSRICPSSAVVFEGGTQKFTCVTGEQDVKTTWLINNEKVDDSDVFQVSGYTLTAYNVRKPDDTASLICLARKDNRTHVSDATLAVIEETLLESTESSVDIPRGNVGYLNVSATVDPDYVGDLQFKWYHEESVLDDHSFAGVYIMQEQNVSNVVIDTNQLNDHDFQKVLGKYQCEITIGDQAPTKNLVFTVSSEGSGFTSSPAAVKAEGSPWWIGLLVAIIVLAIVILIVYLLIRNRELVYPVDKKEREAGHDPEKELEEDQIRELNRTVDLEGDQSELGYGDGDRDSL